MKDLVNKLVEKKGYIVVGLVLIVLTIIIFNSFKTKDEVTTNNNQSGNSNLVSIKFSDEALFLNPDDTYKATLVLAPSDSTEKISYFVNDESVATVSSSGVVTAHKQGVAVLTAISKSNKTSAINIVVKNKEKEVKSVTDIALTEQISLILGQKYTVNYTISPSTASGYEVTWESSDSSIASVNAGVITSVAPGTAVITIKAGSISKSIMVNVTKAKVEVNDLEIFPTDMTLKVGETSSATIRITPSNATDKTVTWVTDSDVISVSDGNITGLKVGTAIVTASIGSKKSSINVTVSEAQVQSSLTLSKTDVTLELGKSFQINAAVTPKTDTIKWISSNEKVFTVSNGLVKSVGVGVAYLSVSSSSGKVVKAKVTVSKTIIAVESINLGEETLYLNLEQSKQLIPVITPANASNKSLIWLSGSDSTVSVTEKGVIKALKYGKTTIAAVTANGKVAKVTVITLPNNPDFKYGEKLSGTELFCSEGGTTADKQYKINDLNTSLNDYIEKSYEIASVIGDINPKRAQVLAAAYWLGFNPYCRVKYKGGFSVATTVKGWWSGWTTHTGIDCHNYIKWAYYQVFGKTYESEILGKYKKIFKKTGFKVDEMVDSAEPGDTLVQQAIYMGSGHVALVLSVDKVNRTITIIHSQGTGIKIQTLTQGEKTKYTAVTNMTSIFGS